MQIGDVVKHKERDEYGTVHHSSFGISLHIYNEEDNCLSKTLGHPVSHYANHWEVVSLPEGYYIRSSGGIQKREMEVVQYFIVNEDLNMSTGKIAAQIAHAAREYQYSINEERQYLHENDEKRQCLNDWYDNGYKTVVLKSSSKKLEELKDIKYPKFPYVIDAGKTEIPFGSLTVVALPPMRRRDAKLFVGGLNTL